MRGVKTLKTAYVTIKGLEAMRALRKGQATIFNLTKGIRGQAHIVECSFAVQEVCNRAGSASVLSTG